VNGIALAVVTDGRDCVHTTIASALAMLEGPITEYWLYDDSGDILHTAALRSRYAPIGFRVWSHPGGRQGFGGAIRYLWSTLTEESDAEWVWHCEDDFTFNREVPLARMATVLRTNAHLAQICLRRQAWNEAEKAAGGIVELNPGDYVDRRDVFGNQWLEHRRCFSSNPCLYRRSLCQRGWPDVKHSEGVFTHDLLADGYRFAYWGDRYDPPWVTHTGHERVGSGY